MPDIIVIGAGISGMTTAWRLLHDHGVESLILESENRSGGKAQTDVADGFTCEEATNSWIDKEPAVRDLLDDMGIADRLQPSDKLAERRFIYRAGSLREMHLHPVKFMLSGVLPLGARLRLAMEPFIPQGNMEREETLGEFAARRLGPGARDMLIGPMASGVYAGDPGQMSLRSCFPKVYELEKNHGSLIKGMLALKKLKKKAGEDPSTVQAGPQGRLTSLKGGISDLTRTLAKKLGSRVRTRAKVVAIEKSAAGNYEVSLEGGEKLHADVVVSAAPAWAAAQFLSSLDSKLAGSFEQIPYPPMDVVCLGFHKSQVAHDLQGFGFLVPRNQKRSILGALWTSSIFPGRAPQDHVLIRSMIGGMLAPEYSEMSSEEIVRLVRDDLEKIMGIGKEETPVFQRIFRHKRAIPQYHVGHSRLVDLIRNAERHHPGFFAGGNALGGVGVIDCVREGRLLADRIANHLNSFGRQ